MAIGDTPGFPGNIGGVLGGTLAALGGAPGAAFSAGSILSIASNLIAGPGGTLFRTLPLSNQKQALYQLRLLDSSLNPVIVWTFPLTPSSLTKEFISLSQFYDVYGGTGSNGVKRVLDNYGNTLPVFSIEGTTGWQYHSSDGYAYTGMDSIKAILDAFSQLAILNQLQLQNNNPNLYLMEFDDHFTGEFWQVVPVGRQAISQDQQRPLIFRYSFRFVAIKDVSLALTSPAGDLLSSLLGIGSSAAAGTLSNSLGTMLTGMAAQTIGGLTSLSATGPSLLGSLFG